MRISKFFSLFIHLLIYERLSLCVTLNYNILTPLHMYERVSHASISYCFSPHEIREKLSLRGSLFTYYHAKLYVLKFRGKLCRITAVKNVNSIRNAMEPPTHANCKWTFGTLHCLFVQWSSEAKRVKVPFTLREPFCCKKYKKKYLYKARWPPLIPLCCLHDSV